MAKLNRNDPCPCGSGKKYKRCCKPKKQPSLSRKQGPAWPKTPPIGLSLGTNRSVPGDDLERDSNRVIDLINEGRLDEAEHAAHEFLRNYPEVHDGFERLAAVYEARGDHERAAEWYQRALDFVNEHDECYEDGFQQFFLDKIKSLSSRNR